jgi:sporulation protein YlmC with PRC-barrel domain
MYPKRLHLERLLGREVIDIDGKNAGRIEEFRAEERDGETVITHYLLGREGLWQRLSISGLAYSALIPLGARRGVATHKVPWDKMDLSDPKHPKLRYRKDDVEVVD